MQIEQYPVQNPIVPFVITQLEQYCPIYPLLVKSTQRLQVIVPPMLLQPLHELPFKLRGKLLMFEQEALVKTGKQRQLPQ